MQKKIIIIGSKKIIRFLSTSLILDTEKIEYINRDLTVSIDLSDVDVVIDLTCFDIQDYNIHYHNTVTVAKFLELSKILGFKYVYGYQVNLFPEEAIYINYSIEYLKNFNKNNQTNNIIVSISDLINENEYVSSFIDFVLSINENSTYIVVNNLQNDIQLASTEDLTALLVYIIKNYKNIYVTEIRLKPDKTISKLAFLNYFIFRQKRVVSIQNGDADSREKYVMFSNPLQWDVVNNVESYIAKFISSQIGRNISTKELNNSTLLAKRELESILGVKASDIETKKKLDEEKRSENLVLIEEEKYENNSETINKVSTDLLIRLNEYDQKFDKHENKERLNKLASKSLLNIEEEQLKENEYKNKSADTKKRMIRTIQYLFIFIAAVISMNEVLFVLRYANLNTNLNDLQKNYDKYTFAKGIVESKQGINNVNNVIRLGERSILNQFVFNIINNNFQNSLLVSRQEFERNLYTFEILSILQNNIVSDGNYFIQDNELSEIQRYLDFLFLNLDSEQDVDIRSLKVLFDNWNELFGYNGQTNILIVTVDDDFESIWGGKLSSFHLVSVQDGIFNLESSKSASEIDNFNTVDGVIGSKEYREDLRQTFLKANSLDWHLNSKSLVEGIVKLYKTTFDTEVDALFVLNNEDNISTSLLGTNSLDSANKIQDMVDILNSSKNSLMYPLLESVFKNVENNKMFLNINKNEYLLSSNWDNNTLVNQSNIFINTYSDDLFTNEIDKKIDIFIDDENNESNIIYDLTNESQDKPETVSVRFILPRNIKIHDWDIIRDGQTASILQNIQVYIYDAERIVASTSAEIQPGVNILYNLKIEGLDSSDLTINFTENNNYTLSVYSKQYEADNIKSNANSLITRQTNN